MEDITNNEAKKAEIKKRAKKSPVTEGTPVEPIVAIPGPGNGGGNRGGAEGAGDEVGEQKGTKGMKEDEVRARALESQRRAEASAGGGLRVSVGPKGLLRAVRAVMGAVGRRSGLPVLGCVRLTARGLSVEVVGTDLDVRMSAVSQDGVGVHAEGSVCVRADALVALLERASGEVELVQRGGELEVRSGGWAAKLYVLPGAEFPTEPDAAVEVMVRMPARVLGRLLGLVKGCVSTDATRYALNGVLLEVLPGGMVVAVATDGRRLGRVWASGAGSEWEEGRCILPTRVVGLLRGVLGSGEEEVELRALLNAQDEVQQVSLQVADGTSLWAKVIDEPFPNYGQAIPDPSVREEVALDVEAFCGMMERARFLARKVEAVSLTMQGRLLTVSVDAGDDGRWQEVGEVLTEEGRAERAVAVTVNPDYLPDLAALERTVVGVNVAPLMQANGPLVWAAETDCGEQRIGWTYVLMPKRVQEEAWKRTTNRRTIIMGAESKIEWTDHTWNLWRGCTEVSPACDHCYARELAKRNPAVLGSWGAGAPRVLAAEAYRKLPLKWNAQAQAARVRKRVFALSMGDWLDDAVPAAWLAELLAMVQATPWLDWLLLTKRPGDFLRRMEAAILAELNSTGWCPSDFLDWLDGWAFKQDRVPGNVWIGTTVEDQARAEVRLPALLKIPARVRFLSCEPLLGPVDLNAIKWDAGEGYFGDCLGPDHIPLGRKEDAPLIHWVIAGGESGHQARPMHPEWVRGLRDQCAAARVPFFFKQWGEWAPGYSEKLPQLVTGPGEVLCRCGKVAAGRGLDGRVWDELPAVNRGDAEGAEGEGRGE